MEAKRIIITADNANLRIVNRLLLSLRDWEFADEPMWDDCSILRTVEDLSRTEDTIDKPPIQEMTVTDFTGKSVEKIEGIMLAKHKAGSHASLFLLLDNKGIEDETIIVVHRAINLNEAKNGGLYLDGYNKVRVPWIEAHSMWCNLSIANMGFDEFCVENQEADKARWFTYRNIMGDDHYQPFIETRDVVLRELNKLDLA